MKTKRNVRFAIIGCGSITAKHITALRRIENAEIVGAHDIDPACSRMVEDQFGVPFFADVERLVAETGPDVFTINTPSGSHARNLFDLMRFERHFVVEKPLALRLADIDTVLAQCRERNLEVFVVQQNRFNPPVRKLKEAMQQRRFGTLVLGTVRVRWCRRQDYYDLKPWRGTWADDGGVLTNQASHHIDMLIWLMGEVDSVMAKTSTRLVTIEAEDTGVALLKFRNGALGVIEATTATRPKDLEGSISVLGERGSVEIGGFFMNELKTWNFAEPHEMDRRIWEDFARVPPEPAWNHTEFYRDVIESLHDGRRGLVDGLEGRRSVELINAIYESVESGREIKLRFSPEQCRLGIAREAVRSL